MVKSIVEQLNDDTFKVLFAGRYDTGKSTLLNKLLGRDLLKIGPGETTKTLAWLTYAEEGKEAAWFHDSEDTLHSIALENIAKIPDDPPVFNVFASIHAEILKHGAVLIDTPGLEVSEESATLTMQAVENADAVILVADHYAVSAHDKRLIEKLQKEGKAKKLFVVLNKMDKVPPDELDGLIKSRVDMLSEMGVRTHIFPLSCKDESAADNGFACFRNELTAYIDTGLQDARETTVEQRVRNTAAYLRSRCEEAAELGKLNGTQNLAAIKENAAARIRETEREVTKIIKANQGEIRRLEKKVLDKWSALYVALKDKVSNTIKDATSEQLNQPNQLLGYIQSEINDFLLREFQAAEDKIRGQIAHALDGVQLPLPQQEGHLEVERLARWDSVAKIPSEFGTVGMLAFTFLTRAHGFFSTIACLPNLYLIFILSPLINKMFEQVIKALGRVSESVFKVQLTKKINENWPEVDNKVRGKINEYFDALSGQMERLGRETVDVSVERDKLALSGDPGNNEKTAQFESYQRQLDAISPKI
jgi:small GTP-binding protein